MKSKPTAEQLLRQAYDDQAYLGHVHSSTWSAIRKHLCPSKRRTFRYVVDQLQILENIEFNKRPLTGTERDMQRRLAAIETKLKARGVTYQ